MKMKKGMNVVCLGDSITAGVQINSSDKWITILNRESKFTYLNKGIPGDTTGGMLARMQRDVIESDASNVLVMGGWNDLIAGVSPGVIQSNIMALVHQAWFHKIVPIVGIPMFFEPSMISKEWREFINFQELEKHVRQYQKWLHQFSKIFHTEVVDFEEGLQVLGTKSREDYLLDGLHPNEAGNLLMAKWILRHE
ncbi:GDSL-type esterase/lipase family protein [Aequitasia blattaphilus]|uniref:GDSL-type esterase/lipase family protein n=1 Tax=Aequitasia blattaphilus TaxID=2949332 RepID=A0ABT1EAS5_9FIRM|nr:GDSL-type esterase/lipase family protein [Aequitasia blattaphilus]MCP1102943.1 GDSL-type esterase/lipase family protein [Aequitasia blattaphilus]MCR8615583.1 GDSL-type esterase/lipase family protein [Aequitasia blattaphilus]